MIERLRSLDLDRDGSRQLRLESTHLELRRAWPRSPDHLVLEYVDERGGIVPGQWMRDTRRLDRVARQTGDADVVVVTAGVERVLLQPHGADRRLVGLREILPERSALVAHRPERRAVVRLPGEPEPRFAKIVRPEAVRSVVEAVRFLEDRPGRPFDLPRVLRFDEKRGLVIWSALAGPTMFDLLDDATQLASTAQHAGVCLRWLHDQPTDTASCHRAEDEARLLEERLAQLSAFEPDLHTRLRAVASPVIRSVAAGTSAPALLHRDFYDKQICVRPDGRLGLLDFDTLACGEAALDLANMLVHLDLRVMQGRLTPGAAVAARAGLIAAYDPTDVVRGRLDAYADGTRLRLACLYAYRPPWPDLPTRLLQAIGDPAV